jgi:hypothetical protein
MQDNRFQIIVCELNLDGKIIKTYIITTHYKKAQKICRRSGCEDPKYKFLHNYIHMLCQFLAMNLVPTKKEKEM